MSSNLIARSKFFTKSNDDTDFAPVGRKGLRRFTQDEGAWSLFVTKNWRMTFRINADEIEIIDLDYEDCH